MRKKVEIIAVQALAAQRAARCSANTEVTQDHCQPGYVLKLHGSIVAYVAAHTGHVEVFDAGYQTATTRSRINAVLQFFAPGWGVVQRDWQWYLSDPSHQLTPWKGAAEFIVPAPANTLHGAKLTLAA